MGPRRLLCTAAGTPSMHRPPSATHLYLPRPTCAGPPLPLTGLAAPPAILVGEPARTHVRRNRPMLRSVNVKLYSLPGSHPCAAVEVALGLKGIEYKRVDLLPLSQLAIGPLLYGGNTVPGLRIDGERLAGSRTIMRRLDTLVPEPTLLPPLSDAVARARVLEAERWGDEVLQSVPRRLLDAAFLRNPRCMESYVGDAKMPLPTPLMRPAMPLTAKLMAKRNKADDAKAQADSGGTAGAVGAHRRLDRRRSARRRAAQRCRPADR